MIDLTDLYLQAAIESLRANRTLFPTAQLAAASCLVMPDDKAPPNAGYLFIGLRGADTSIVGAHPRRLHDKAAIVTVITIRTDNIPTDRKGASRYSKHPATVSDRPSINQIKSEILRTLHQSDALLGLVQTRLASQEPGVLEWPALGVLNYASGSSTGPQVVGPEHFEAGDERAQVEGRNESGLVFRMTFTGAERYQAWPPAL